ncbi:MAG TPA: hypothetical protein DIC34_19880 [Treponema sp.]|nr:MAG: hypothetical protein A2001_06165 [Treponema sp. GWC1_61_84]HCM28761.1 hypothetical protein [Treponema sp.]
MYISKYRLYSNNRMKDRIRRIRSVAVLFLLAAAAAHALDDYRPRIAVVPMRNLTGDPAYDSLCRAVDDTVALVLRLLGPYSVVDVYDEPVLAANGVGRSSADVDLTALEDLAAALKLDEIVLGSAAKSDEAYLVFNLKLYSASGRKLAHDTDAAAETLFDVLEAADGITAALIGKLSDVHIGFGELRIEEKSGLGGYDVYLNDERIRNPQTMLKKVLNGRYSLTARQDRLSENEVVFRTDVEIFEDRTTELSFALPGASREEYALLDRRIDELMDATTTGSGLESALSAISSFQSVVRAADFDDGLCGRAGRALEEAGARAGGLLAAAVAEGDAGYAARKPDFAGARERYAAVSRLLNDTYAYSPAFFEPYTLPTRVLRAKDGTVYTLGRYFSGGEVGSRLYRVAPGGDPVAPAGGEMTTPAVDADIAIGADSRLRLLDGERGVVVEYDGAFAVMGERAIPDFKREGDATSVSRLAISDDGVYYILAAGGPYVLDPKGERDAAAEKSIARALPPSGNVASFFFNPDGELVAFDPEAGAIIRLDEIGRPLVPPAVLRCSAGLSAIAMDGAGSIYAVAPEENRIYKFAPDGEEITHWGAYGSGDQAFSRPEGIFAEADGALLVADTYNNRALRLVPTSPPLVIPSLARMGPVLVDREKTAGKAAARMEAESKASRPLRSFGDLLGFAAFAGGAAGATWLSAVETAAYSDAFSSYGATDEPEELRSYRDEMDASWARSSYAKLGACAFGAASGAFLGSFFLDSWDETTRYGLTVRLLRSRELGAEYEIDRDRYRSLRGASAFGALTGVAPPLVSAGAAAALYLFAPDSEPVSALALAAAGIAVPPVFSHLYGGELDVGLFLAGLCADALAAGSIYLAMDAASLNEPFDAGGDPVASILAGARANAPLLLMSAAFGLRMAAGIHDASKGWLRAKDYNAFKAVRKKEGVSPLSVSVLDPAYGPGVYLTLRN